MILSQLDSGTFKGITPRPVTCLCPKPILPPRGLVKTHRNKGPYPLPFPFANFIDPSLKLKSYPSPPPPPNTHSHKLFVPFLFIFRRRFLICTDLYTKENLQKGKLNKTVIKQRVEIFIRWREAKSTKT